MFDYGTKVIVLASSHRGGIGPKKGSLAFYSGEGNTPHFLFHKEKNCVFNHVNLSFFRYGFEKTLRNERREAIVLMPLISENYADFSGQVLKLLRRVHSGKDTFWNPIRKNCGTNAKTPVVILAPVGSAGDNILKKESPERLAWLESILRNNSMGHWITQAVSDKHLNRSFHPALNYDSAFLLRELVAHKGIREEYAYSVSPERMENAFTSVITANIVKNRRNIEDRLSLLNHIIYSNREFAVRIGDGKINKDAVSVLLYQHLFQPYMIKKVKEMLVRDTGTEVIPFFEESELVRGCLLELSACLVRTGKTDGKKAMSVGQ